MDDDLSERLRDKAGGLLEETVVRWPSGEIPIAQLIERFERSEIAVYLTGGTVRDLILGRRPSDVDLIGTAPVGRMAEVAAREFGADSIDILNEALGLLRIGRDEDYVDLNMFRDIESVRGARSLAEVRWAYSGRPESDALTTDFTMNALYWHPDHGLVDPLGGTAHCLERTLVISADPRKAAIDPKLSFRLARFACLGFRPSEESLAFFRDRINGDAPRYGALLGPYLHELTRGSREVKLSMITFCERHGADRSSLELIRAAVVEEPVDHRPYAASNSASPLEN